MSGRRLALLALVVADYDEAVRWYAALPGFRLIEDAPQPDGKRWVVVGPETGTALLLAQAATEAQRQAIGMQAGGRVLLFLETDDFARDHAMMLVGGVEFEEAPRREPYGMVAVFRDLYGNRWDLVQYRQGADEAA